MKKIFFTIAIFVFTGIHSMDQQLKHIKITAEQAYTNSTISDLFIAASKGNSDLFFQLLKYEGNILRINDEGKSLLHYAARGGNTSIIQCLLEKGISPNITDKCYITPLHEAAFYNRLDAIKLLIQQGAQINIRNAFGRTALHDAVTRQSGWEAVSDTWTALVEFLIAKGAEVDCIDNNDETPLDKAIKERNLPVATLLLSAGANPRRRSRALITPLHRAAYLREFAIVQLLLKNKASVHDQNCWGRTALHDVAASPVLIHCKDLIALLLQHGADINCVDENGETPLFKAVENKDSETVEFLLLNGALPNKARKGLITPLHHAVFHSDFVAMHKSLAIISALITHQAHVNAHNAWMRTPLHDAFENGNQEIIKILLKAGAHTTPADEHGRTPLEIRTDVPQTTTIVRKKIYSSFAPVIPTQQTQPPVCHTEKEDLIFELELPEAQ